MSKYLPYVNAHGSIKDLFAQIQKAAVPPKFTQDFLATKLGFKSSSHRALIPLLKRLGFIDPSNAPTEAYKNFRDPKKAGRVMAQQLKASYADLFAADEYAQDLKKAELVTKLSTVTGASLEDPNLHASAATFLALKDLASFDDTQESEQDKPPQADDQKSEEHDDSYQKNKKPHRSGYLGLSYTINLNLPATTEVEVFDAIFKSLKEHILSE